MCDGQVTKKTAVKYALRFLDTMLYDSLTIMR